MVVFHNLYSVAQPSRVCRTESVMGHARSAAVCSTGRTRNSHCYRLSWLPVSFRVHIKSWHIIIHTLSSSGDETENVNFLRRHRTRTTNTIDSYINSAIGLRSSSQDIGLSSVYCRENTIKSAPEMYSTLYLSLAVKEADF